MDEGGIPTPPERLKTSQETYKPEDIVEEKFFSLEDLKKKTQLGNDESLAMRLTNVKHIN